MMKLEPPSALLVHPAGVNCNATCWAVVPLLATRDVHIPHSMVHRAVVHTDPCLTMDRVA